jgi:hypothetical protein
MEFIDVAILGFISPFEIFVEYSDVYVINPIHSMGNYLNSYAVYDQLKNKKKIEVDKSLLINETKVKENLALTEKEIKDLIKRPVSGLNKDSTANFENGLFFDQNKKKFILKKKFNN